MNSTVFAAAVGSVVALVGFAGAANASATIDLIWIEACEISTMGAEICLLQANRNCPVDPRAVGLSGFPDGVALDSEAFIGWPCNDWEITVVAILTAGPNGSIGAGVSVNYGDALPHVNLTEFRRFTTTKPFVYLPLSPGSTTNQPPYIDNIGALADPPAGMGSGLPPGVTAYLGTVMFFKDIVPHGTFEISVGTDGPGGTDDVFDGSGNNITATTTFNSAFLLPEPNASMALGSGIAMLALLYRRRLHSIER